MVALLHWPDAKVSGVAALVRDDTARWNDERALKARVRALEMTLRRVLCTGGYACRAGRVSANMLPTSYYRQPHEPIPQ